MILEFNTQSEAQSMLDEINNHLVEHWKRQGYETKTVDGVTSVVGKNAKTQTSSTTKALTQEWDVVKKDSGGKFYFTSIRGTVYEELLDELKTRFQFTEKENYSFEKLSY